MNNSRSVREKGSIVTDKGNAELAGRTPPLYVGRVKLKAEHIGNDVRSDLEDVLKTMTEESPEQQ